MLWLDRLITRSRKSRKTVHGFSLIEFTVVLALMGLLAGIITLSVRPLMVRGKQNAARAEIATISQALDVFYSVYGRYPTNDEGLAVLSAKTDKAPDGFLKEAPIDPWGHPYQYNCPGRINAYEVISFGADGKEGGEGTDADISSDDLKEHAHLDGSH
jgi:general secretion pathway protein G